MSYHTWVFFSRLLAVVTVSSFSMPLAAFCFIFLIIVGP